MLRTKSVSTCGTQSVEPSLSMYVQEIIYGVNVGLVKEKKSFVRASQEKMWKCLNYRRLGGAHIIMNLKLRMFAYKIER